MLQLVYSLQTIINVATCLFNTRFYDVISGSKPGIGLRKRICYMLIKYLSKSESDVVL